MFDAVEYTPMTTATKRIHQAHRWDGNPDHPGADVWFDKTFYLAIFMYPNRSPAQAG